MRGHYLFGMPFLTLTIEGEELDALLDTGFNGALMLPEEVLKKWRCDSQGTVQYALADASEASAQVYFVNVDWLGKEITVRAIAGPSDFALVGMELLNSCFTRLAPSRGILDVISAA